MYRVPIICMLLSISLCKQSQWATINSNLYAVNVPSNYNAIATGVDIVVYRYSDICTYIYDHIVSSLELKQA